MNRLSNLKNQEEKKNEFQRNVEQLSIPTYMLWSPEREKILEEIMAQTPPYS